MNAEMNVMVEEEGGGKETPRLLPLDIVQKRVLTRASVRHGEEVFKRWQQLSTDIFTKFNDGYIRGVDGSYPKEGDPYPDPWLRRVVEEKGEQLKVPK
jgi:hypothetical protein